MASASSGEIQEQERMSDPCQLTLLQMFAERMVFLGWFVGILSGLALDGWLRRRWPSLYPRNTQ